MTLLRGQFGEYDSQERVIGKPVLLVVVLGGGEVGRWWREGREGSGGNGVLGCPRPRLPHEGDFAGGHVAIVNSARSVGHRGLLSQEPAKELVILVDLQGNLGKLFAA